MKPPGKARTDRNPHAPHHKKYRTLYLSNAALAKLDKLKAEWFLAGRGKVVEKLIRLYEAEQEKRSHENDIESRI